MFNVYMIPIKLRLANNDIAWLNLGLHPANERRYN